MVLMHGIGDSQTLENFPRAHRFEASNREADFRLRAKFDEFNENLRGREVDFDDAACLQNDEIGAACGCESETRLLSPSSPAIISATGRLRELQFLEEEEAARSHYGRRCRPATQIVTGLDARSAIQPSWNKPQTRIPPAMSAKLAHKAK
jgi:hypothetical protein